MFLSIYALLKMYMMMRSILVCEISENQYWFDQNSITWGFPFMIRLSDLNARDSGLLVNDELKIVAEIDVLEVVGELDVPVVSTDTVEINGFQVLVSQVKKTHKNKTRP